MRVEGLGCIRVSDLELRVYMGGFVFRVAVVV